MDKDRQPVIAIIGGWDSDQTGMELWNPTTHKVELLWEVIPPEIGGAQGLKDSEMVVIKGGKEFLLYGGYHGLSQDSIWKYESAKNTWER